MPKDVGGLGVEGTEFNVDEIDVVTSNVGGLESNGLKGDEFESNEFETGKMEPNEVEFAEIETDEHDHGKTEA